MQRGIVIAALSSAVEMMLDAGTAAAASYVVPQGYVDVANEHGIPPRILYAVAMQESALLLPSGIVRPWPWTLNVEGRAERFRGREEAHQALTWYLRSGVRSIDIGLMQVNWRWHGDRLRDPWTALDPYFNLRVGATILAEHYRSTGDWQKAIGLYHASANTPAAKHRAENYRADVNRHLGRMQ